MRFTDGIRYFNRIRSILLLVLTLLFLASCSSDELDRAKAEKLIRPLTDNIASDISSFNLDIRASGYYQGRCPPYKAANIPPVRKKFVNEIQKLGFLKEVRILDDYAYNKRNTLTRQCEYVVILSESANPYIVDRRGYNSEYMRQWIATRVRFAARKQKLIRITGIRKMSDSESIVEYELETSLNGFGKKLAEHGWLKDIGKRIKTGRRTFKKYDDGWRIVNSF